jgi:hypothetical protein
MELFHKNGHISQEGFQLLIEEKADLLQRLELSEHLSFCEECMENYLNLLDKVQEPSRLVPSMQAKVFQAVTKKKAIKKRDYLMTVAAACIALFLWSSGVFQWGARMGCGYPSETMYNQVLLMSQKADDFSWKLYRGYHGMMDKINWKGDYYENK